MSDTLSGVIENITTVLKDRGFDKEASVVEAAGFEMPSGVGKWSPTMMQPAPRSSPQEVAPTGPQQFAEKGEIITELDPVTGKEKMILWGIKKPFTVDELIDATKKGYLAVEYFNDQYQNAKDHRTKKFFKDMLEKAENYRKQHAVIKMASLGNLLIEKGYDTLGKRLLTAADNVSTQIKHLLDKHETPSLEAVYELSGSAKHFEENIQKLVSVYENIVKIIRDFDKEYLDKILHPIDRKEVTEEEATKNTMNIIRSTDAAVDKKFKEVANSISQKKGV